MKRLFITLDKLRMTFGMKRLPTTFELIAAEEQRLADKAAQLRKERDQLARQKKRLAAQTRAAALQEVGAVLDSLGIPLDDLRGLVQILKRGIAADYDKTGDDFCASDATESSTESHGSRLPKIGTCPLPQTHRVC